MESTIDDYFTISDNAGILEEKEHPQICGHGNTEKEAFEALAVSQPLDALAAGIVHQNGDGHNPDVFRLAPCVEKEA